MIMDGMAGPGNCFGEGGAILGEKFTKGSGTASETLRATPPYGTDEDMVIVLFRVHARIQQRLIFSTLLVNFITSVFTFRIKFDSNVDKDDLDLIMFCVHT